MNRSSISGVAGLMAAAALMLSATPALAQRPHVDWSISIGTPGYYSPAEVYAPQAPVYAAPYPAYGLQSPYYPAPHHDSYERDDYAERQWREHRWHEQQLREQARRERHWRRDHGHD